MKRRMEEIRSELQSEIREKAARHDVLLQRINENVKRITAQPVVRTAAQSLADLSRGDGIDSHARLASGSNVRTLYDLWVEYELGLAGHKPARHFTPAERGRVKFTYSLRLNFWQVVDRMVRAGHTSDVAIDKVYGTYGVGETVTKILRKMRSDKKGLISGIHPSLV